MLTPFYKTPNEAGTDEAGRGCLAGPVTAAAIILPKDFAHPLLNDSKQLSQTQRDYLRPLLEKEAVAFAVCHVSPDEIDQINILNASFLAMHRALDQLSPPPSFIVVDGNRFTPYPSIAYQCIVKGDGKYRNIAAASVLAKTHRDAYMAELHKAFPVYNWEKNKGYPTKAHREAINKYGLSPHHRKSFRQLPKALTLEA